MVLISGGWMPIVYSMSDEEKTSFSLGSLSHYMGFAWHLLHQALNPTKVPGILKQPKFIAVYIALQRWWSTAVASLHFSLVKQ